MLKGLRVGSFRGRLYFKTLVMFFMCTIYENYFSRLEEFGEKNEVLGSLKFIFLFFLTKADSNSSSIYFLFCALDCLYNDKKL